jgi:hypothetical protein
VAAAVSLVRRLGIAFRNSSSVFGHSPGSSGGLHRQDHLVAQPVIGPRASSIPIALPVPAKQSAIIHP